MEQLSFIIKTTPRCTLSCNYCSFTPFVQGAQEKTMERNILTTSLEKILNLPINKVSFIWHGGEPLLPGVDFYQTVVKLQNELTPNHKKIRNNIQTNGTIINSDWIDFFEAANFNVGISIDGPVELHNAHRKFPSGKGSFQTVLDGISLIQNGKNIKAGYIAVITEDSADKAEKIFNFFLEKKIKSFDFLPCLNFGNVHGSALPIEPLKYAQFLIEFFDLWFAYDDPEIKIRVFENILMGMLGGKPSLCRFAGSCANFLTINYNGDIYPCDKFLGCPELKFGNILSDDLNDILLGENYQAFVNGTNNINSECSKCRWLSLCNGGCTYLRYEKRKVFSDTNSFCEANKIIFSHIMKRLDE